VGRLAAGVLRRDQFDFAAHRGVRPPAACAKASTGKVCGSGRTKASQIKVGIKVRQEKGEIMVIEDLEHRFEQLGQRIELVRSYL
jgi:hypothetical protein